MRDSFFAAFLIVIVVTGLFFLCDFHSGVGGQVSSNVGGVIDQDTTWTLSGSPYTVAKDMFVNHGMILTIQPGVTVNLGNHKLEINGTLTALGTSDSPVQFNSGTITLTSTSNGFNKQTGLGSDLENGIFNKILLTCDNTTKINQCKITGIVKGELGLISYSAINGEVNGDVVSSSIITGKVNAKTILNNKIIGDITPFASAQNNNITGIVNIVGNCIVSNNFIQRNIAISSGTSTISSNTITSPSTAIDINASASFGYVETTIKSNQILGAQIGINMESDTDPTVFGWTSRATILLNSITGSSYAGILVDSQADLSANPYGNRATIIENVVSNNNYGIQANYNSTI
jgi:hypothetical protein